METSKDSLKLIPKKFIRTKIKLLKSTLGDIKAINQSTVDKIKELLTRIKGQFVDAIDNIFLVCETSYSKLYKNDGEGLMMKSKDSFTFGHSAKLCFI